MEGLIAKGLVGGILEVLDSTTTTSTGVMGFLGVAMIAKGAAAAEVVFLLFVVVAVVAPMTPARRILLLPCHLFLTSLELRPGSWADIFDHLWIVQLATLR